MSELNKILEIASQEIGYIEKATNRDLDSKTANAGSGNFTKYARDLDKLKFYNTPKNGYAWCDVFVDWCFVKAVGENRALELLCQYKGSCGAGCGFSLNYYKEKGQFYTNPKIGDQIFFCSGSEISHTGLVYNVDNSRVYTIEGNTSDVNYVDGNGGKVCKKSYPLNANYIKGYGRPKYNEELVPQPTPTYTHEQFVKDVQKAIGAKIDGIPGPETLSKTVTISKSKNRRHAVVKAVQKYLISLGYSLPKFGADGDFGNETDKAIKKYQVNNGCVADGEITARNLTWKKLLKLL